jgi:hypothetical protein
MHHEHGYAPTLGMNMQNLHEPAAMILTCSMFMDMQRGHRYAPIDLDNWTCSMEMVMQHGHGHVAWT